MANKNRTDNANLASKLTLRRWFIEQHHAGEELHVFDACQGSGVIWRHLREQFQLASYWGVDVKPEPGRLKVDSIRVLQAGLSRQNLIDVDTYGSPWRHWEALLHHVRKPTSVFLTIGQARTGPTDRQLLAWMGLAGFRYVPPMLQDRAEDRFGFACAMRQAAAHGLRIADLRESPKSKNARYIGVFLVPA